VTPKRIVIVGYDGITSLDLTGPLEAFSSAFVEDSNGNPQPCYQVMIAALGAKTFRSESGLRMTAASSLSSLRHMDTLLIPGGRGARLSPAGPKLADWISRRANGIRRIASVANWAASDHALEIRRPIGRPFSCVEDGCRCALHS
jgi:transcriptional regulator GlxA family with amidase domain